MRSIVRALAAAALLSVGAVADATWYRASSKHFVVYADDGMANVKRFAERLERFDKAIRVWHMAKEDTRGPSARVTVFVVKDVDAIQRLAGSRYVAGFYNARAGESVAFTPRTTGDSDLSSRAILFHEYTHHWMLSNWTDAALPPWFVEGFAELHATAIMRDDQVVFGAVPDYRRYTIGQMNLMPMSRMLRFDPGRLSPAERDALYSHGWALTHYLTFDPERRKRLADYIAALNSGKAADATRLIGNGEKLDFRIASYIRRPSLPSAAFPVADLPIGPIEVVPLSPSEAAIMPALIQSQRGVDARSAGAVVALARRLAAPFPHDAAAQNELAEAEYDACSTDEKADAACFARAAAAADRALAADGRSVHALTYKGLAATGALARGKVTDAARWAVARRPFLEANKIDTEAPQPLIDFYDSFGEAGRPATANAQAGLLYAYALAPYDGELRMKAAGVYLTQNKTAEARIALAPVAYGVEDQKTATPARAALDAIDAGDTRAALAALSGETKKPAAD